MGCGHAISIKSTIVNNNNPPPLDKIVFAFVICGCLLLLVLVGGLGKGGVPWQLSSSFLHLHSLHPIITIFASFSC
jgi:hypothetical protein